MNAMAAGDLDQMVGTFAVETYVDNFDFDVYLARIRAYSPFVAPLLVPPATPFTRALDVEQRQGASSGRSPASTSVWPSRTSTSHRRSTCPTTVRSATSRPTSPPP